MRSRKVLQLRGRVAGEAGEAGGPGGQLAVRLAVGHQQAGRHEAGAHACQLLALRHHLGQARQSLRIKAVSSQKFDSRTVACMPHSFKTSMALADDIFHAPNVIDFPVQERTFLRLLDSVKE